MKLSQLYIISEGPDGPVKVGVSSNPSNRLMTLQIGNPRNLKVIATYSFPASEVYTVEDMFHSDFDDRSILGEWFDLSESLILDCMSDFFKSNGYQVAA